MNSQVLAFLSVTYVCLTGTVYCQYKLHTLEEEIDFHGQVPVHVTYVHVNQEPYEYIINNTWEFHYGDHKKTLYGVISRTINYIMQKHCKKYHLDPHLVPNYRNLTSYLKMSSAEELRANGLKGDHFIFAPVPINADIYYKLHYFPEHFSWQDGFAKSKGLVTIRRINDVDLTKRIIRAVGKSKLLFGFLGIMTLIAATTMWVIDRKWKNERDGNIFSSIFCKIYWAFVTMTTVGYGDVVPERPIAKVVGIIWMLLSLVVVSCMTSIITSDIVDNSISVKDRTVGVVEDTWDEFLGRLLVNHKRSKRNVLPYTTYEDLFDAVRDDEELYAGLIDQNVASAMIDEIQSRDLGKALSSYLCEIKLC